MNASGGAGEGIPRPSERDHELVVRVRPDLAAVAREFDYLVPDAMADAVRVGTIVRVPLHGRRVRGWVVADNVLPEADPDQLLPIAKVVGAGPPAELLALARWTAHRWAGSEVAVLRAASPPNAVREAWPDVAIVARTGFSVGVEAWPPAADRRELVAARIASVGSTLVLVPDGHRLGTLVRDLGRRGHRVLVLRADHDDAARTRAWAACRRGRCVVVGGRVAVWAPVPDLASVIVLDEGDEGYQEERTPTWHARDVALERAARADAPILLVAPVPSPEAQVLVPTVKRPAATVERTGWPHVVVVDLREEPPGQGLLSEALARELRAAVDAGERAVCVLNRRGRARVLTCLRCSTVATCERCDAGVVEGDQGELRCPRCDAVRPRICTACHSTRLRASRLGIRRLRDAVDALLPRVDVAWLDRTVDEVPDAPVIVGTEAVLHRADARLVAFLELDHELLAPRVRAAQQAATLLGRAARLVGTRDRGGRLLLQTRVPDHPVVQWAMTGDPTAVMDAERARRRALGARPFGATAEVSGEADAVRAALDALTPGVRVVGPSAQGAGLAALVHAADAESLAAAFADAAPAGRAAGRLRIAVDPPRV